MIDLNLFKSKAQETSQTRVKSSWKLSRKQHFSEEANAIICEKLLEESYDTKFKCYFIYYSIFYTTIGQKTEDVNYEIIYRRKKYLKQTARSFS